jgi:hypothetical protein
LELNCGVEDHDMDCLCDVVVKEPAPVLKDWVRDSWLGREIVKELGLSSPWTPDKILYLLETQTAAHDLYMKHRYKPTAEMSEKMRRARSFRTKRLNQEQLQELRVMAHEGATSGDLRRHCATIWNVEISKSWSCKLRVELLRTKGVE